MVAARGFDAPIDQLPEVPDRADVARFHLGDGVMRLGLVGIYRCGEANAVLGGKAERVVVELGQVAEHLDELEADGLGGDEEPVEIAIELRLAADELKLAAAKVVGFTHEPVVVGRRQKVAIAGMGVATGCSNERTANCSGWSAQATENRGSC